MPNTESISGRYITVGAATTNNSAVTTEAAKTASTSAPTTDTANGIYVFPATVNDSGEVGANPIHRVLGFALTDADNEEGQATVWGWRRLSDADGDNEKWVPHLLLDLDITAGGEPGVGTTGDVTSSFFFADTISINTDNTGGAVSIHGTSAGDNIMAIKFDQGGFELLEVECTTAQHTSTDSASIVPFMGAM